MTHPASPYALPATIEADLAEVHTYWQSLIRGQASDMPYWDDVKLSALPRLEDRMMLIGVFEKPERFRFEIIGRRITEHYGKDVTGSFADEIASAAPLEYLRAQASATVESRAPTYVRHGAQARLLLPLWGNGRISMLLGAVA
ncbi:MAG TPA: hypothetical protein PKA57_07085 [Parvibaculum sp.]|uniref:hypothetical protein n=1 Tax=Parvibaculum sp. TaxID=2024848 RepID=UPI002C05E449|nr:hypothetical protein [Parvibaculum sp.]HMM14379.1 hypothetical protein [Parvibaculum sp.]